jgi:crotonobetainyl-CoA:carnitine CoA-transferase CaiB-like acyl-CoA transferase
MGDFSAGALTGLRVLEIGHYIAAPLAGMLLADQGAEVIQLSPPWGHAYNPAASRVWQRGKGLATLNLALADDQRSALLSAADADVVIENLQTGKLDSSGFGPLLMKVNPRLIYVSLPGFASDDPRSGVPGWEGVIGAATASYRLVNGRPHYTAIPISSTFAALLAVNAILAALLERERSGKGQHIEIPLFDATFAAIGANALRVNGKPGGGRPDEYLGGRFRCADGRWVQLNAPGQRLRERFAKALSLESWEGEGLLDLQRLAKDEQLQAELRQRLTALFASEPAEHWETVLAEAGVPLAVCRSTGDWLTQPAAEAGGSVVSVDDTVLGRMTQPGLAVQLSATPGGIRPQISGAARPTDALEVAASEPDSMAAALAGVRVLDVSQMLAGPMAGRTLAEFGAEVIKVNNPHEEGAGYTSNVHRYHTDVNRGKLSALIDFKTPEGREALEALLERSDVLIHNFLPGVPERLGLDWETLHRRHPRLVSLEISAYGPTGPWASRRGYEVQAQASSGIQERAGGDAEPAAQPFPLNDYGTGLLGSYGALLALFHRARTGEAQRAQTALAYTATLLQSPFAQLYAGKVWDEPRGKDTLGPRPEQRLYQTSDGWLWLGAHEFQADAVAEVLGLVLQADASPGQRAALYGPVFLTRASAEWERRLWAAGLGSHRLVTLDELVNDPWVQAHGLVATRLHDTGEEITTVGPPVRLSRTPVVMGEPAHSPGADTEAVLQMVRQPDRAGRPS